MYIIYNIYQNKGLSVYNLNTNDGYTKIEDNKYESNESEALVFKSNKMHFGCGPTKGLRYNLNIVFS